MAYFDTAHAPVSSNSWIDRILSRLNRGMKAAQYGKMIQVMHGLSDEQLTQIDVKRSEITRHAHRAIYGATRR